MGISLSVDLAPRHPNGLRLRNPVMTASGTFGYGTEYAKVMEVERLGALVSKGTTLQPRPGNPQPRLAETPAGMLNTIGLQNVGVHALVRDKAPIWARWEVPVIVNIAGDTIDEYARIAEVLEGTPGIAALEINVSCPNVKAGGLAFGVNAEAAAEVVSAVRSVSSFPLIPKLSPNVTDIVAIATAVVDAGADAVSLINTVVGMVIDIRSRRPYLSTITGGLSGPAIRPIALRMVYQVAKHVGVPVVGIGGITSTEDALQFLMAGASAIQVGSASFANPQAPIEIVEGLARFLNDEGVDDIREIVGVAL
ncbi:MAG: dihydroorotate dehydrogenase [Chloroflexi bacterium]|nr:dihydroorotate dehydrogenase [Chloroflexota bacterium]